MKSQSCAKFFENSKEGHKLGEGNNVKSRQDLSFYIKNRQKYSSLSEHEVYSRNFDIKRFPEQKKSDKFEQMKYNEFYQECRYSLLNMRHDHAKEFKFEKYVPLESLAEQILLGNNLK